MLRLSEVSGENQLSTTAVLPEISPANANIGYVIVDLVAFVSMTYVIISFVNSLNFTVLARAVWFCISR